ncbi:hypothetical protein R1sor_000396 [Riccia sorocarpa]|uniref:Uncharacterized protein n=1 Tax=Riccia sorocarpa TaxID=122646 RepID=A0ABD3GWZ6_9MARC
MREFQLSSNFDAVFHVKAYTEENITCNSARTPSWSFLKLILHLQNSGLMQFGLLFSLYILAVLVVNGVYTAFKVLHTVSMEARRTTREHIRDSEFLPVPATDPIYQYQPTNLSTGNPSFSLPPQFRIPFAMQGVPHYPSSMPVHRPSVVRNFMEPLPREVMPQPTTAGPSFYKWKKLASEFRKINDYSKLSGKVSYEALDAEQREAAKLPPHFPDNLYQLLDSFLGNKAVNNHILSQSASIPSFASEDEPVVTDIPVEGGASASASERTDDGGESSRFNSGKRKKEVSKSAHAIVTAMSDDEVLVLSLMMAAALLVVQVWLEEECTLISDDEDDEMEPVDTCPFVDEDSSSMK